MIYDEYAMTKGSEFLNHRRLAQLLHQHGLITGEDVRKIEVLYQNTEARLKKRIKDNDEGGNPLPWEVIPEMGIINQKTGHPIKEEEILKVISEETGIPFEKIDPVKVDVNFSSKYITRPFARKHNIIPLREEDNYLVVATSNPFNLEAISTIANTSRKNVKPVLSPRKDIDKIVRDLFGFRSSVEKARTSLSSGFDLGNLEQYVKMKADRELEATDSYIVNAVDYMLRYALDQRASDIHMEPKREEGVIRFRIDGVLHTIYKVPRVVHNAMVARIKAIAKLDIAEKRKPQDGRIKTKYKDREVEIRISTMPVAFGEKIVMRLLDPKFMFKDLRELGFSGRDLELFEHFIKHSHGIILVTGPTGSGKTTTLYSALKKLDTPDVNIITIEDPIEMVYEGFNQINVNPSVGLDFAQALRHILRQDPDIIMVGEIRDYETARNAIQAALTGHLVLSTLHTNDAPSAITRLIDIGVEPFLIASTLIGIVAQRLVRTICPHCKEEKWIPEEDLKPFGVKLSQNKKKLKVMVGKGCSMCRNTGFLGRTAIFEILPVDEEIKKLIASKAPEDEIRKVALKKGMQTLKMAGLKKVLNGETTIEEVLRVTL